MSYSFFESESRNLPVNHRASFPQRQGSRIAPSGDRDSFIKPDKHDTNEAYQIINKPDPITLTGDDGYVPPWTEPYIIGIAGSSGSGKTSVATKIINEINTPWTVLMSLDDFYKALTPEQNALAHESNYDFDCPESMDLDEAAECIWSLKQGKKTDIPVYSFVQHAKTDKVNTIYGANVIIVEGLFTLYTEKLRNLFNMMIYVDTDLDICLARRLTRDIVERGRDPQGVLDQWSRFVKPNTERYLKPTMKYADLVIPRGSENTIAIDLLIKHIRKQLLLKSESHLSKLNKLTGKKDVNGQNYPGLHFLESTNQTRGIYSILIDKNTSRDDFIFYFDRIASTLINKGLEFQNFKSVQVVTPLGVTVKSIKPSYEVVAVNIIRSGDCFMHSIRKTIPEIAIGKLLIQSDASTGEPQLHTNALPKDIGNNKQILLFDAQIISGAAVIMAIQVLIDYGVEAKNIIFVCFMATEIGLSRILRAFRNIKVVVGAIGYRKNLEKEQWFRHRFIDEKYFGTP